MCKMELHKESDVLLLSRMKVERKETDKRYFSIFYLNQDIVGVYTWVLLSEEYRDVYVLGICMHVSSGFDV